METITIQLSIDNLKIEPETGNLVITLNGETLKGLLLERNGKVTEKNGKERNQKRYMQNLVNENLKVISKALKRKEPLTMYVARHTWASLARDNGIPLKTISLAMGHESEKTTQIYLKNLDVNAVDRANREIINLINT